MDTTLTEDYGSARPACLSCGSIAGTALPAPGRGPGITGENLSLASILSDPPVCAAETGEPGRHDPGCRIHPGEQSPDDDLRWYLLNKYRVLLADPITAGELGELLSCRTRRHGRGGRGDGERLRRFVRRLQESVPDEILRQEIAGIAALLMLLRPEDLPAIRKEAAGQGVSR